MQDCIRGSKIQQIFELRVVIEKIISPFLKTAAGYSIASLMQSTM